MRAGAKHVIGVDMSTIIDKAREIVERNGMSSKITLLQGKMEEVVLPYDKVDIIKKLEDIASADPDLRERLGENFARGHKEASGGIVGTAEWEELKRLMAIGEGNRKKGDGARKKDAKPAQKNTLTNYFAKK